MIASLSLILLCQLAGEAFVRGVGWPMPGPVIGLMLLVGILPYQLIVASVDPTVQYLLAHWRF